MRKAILYVITRRLFTISLVGSVGLGNNHCCAWGLCKVTAIDFGLSVHSDFVGKGFGSCAMVQLICSFHYVFRVK